MFGQLLLNTIDDRITHVARYIREPAYLLLLVVIVLWLITSLDGKDHGRNVFTTDRGTTSFLGFVLILAFFIGLGLFDLDIGSPAAPLIAFAVLGLAGTVWYLIDRRTIRRDGPSAFAKPRSPVGVLAVPLAPGWYADPWQVTHWRWWDGITWTAYVHQTL
jgi:hypothetical protein